MLGLVKYASGPGKLELREIPEPQVIPGSVKIAVKAAGVCGTDIHIMRDEYPHRPPVVLGHEMAGEIVEAGAGVDEFRVGDHVTALPFAHTCGRCRHCLNGEPALCEERLSFGSGLDGAFAPYLVLPAHVVRHLPAGVSFEVGALAEPLACCVKAIQEKAGIRAGDRVLITGPGPIGLICTRLAKVQGALVTLAGLSSDRNRLDIGRELGADRVIELDGDSAEDCRGLSGCDKVDFVIECSGASPAVQIGLDLLQKRGCFVQLGLFGRPVAVNCDQLVLKDIRLIGSFSSNLSSWERALRLMERGTLSLETLISAVFPIRRWEEAFDMAAGKEGAKILLVP